jgi:tetratricopeptide (TPR) repeat protein
VETVVSTGLRQISKLLSLLCITGFFFTACAAEQLNGNSDEPNSSLRLELKALQENRQSCLNGASKHNFGTEEEKHRFHLSQEAWLLHFQGEEHQRWEESCINRNKLQYQLEEGVTQLLEKGVYDKAIDLNGRLLQGFSEIFGKQSPEVANRLYYYGQIYVRSNRPIEAERYYRAALTMYAAPLKLEKVMDNYPGVEFGVTTTRLGLFELYQTLARRDEAKAILDQAAQQLESEIAIYRQNPQAKSKTNLLKDLLAQVYRKQKRDAEASVIEKELDEIEP